MGSIKITESSCQGSQDVVCEKYENTSVSVESSQVEQPGMDYKFFYTGLLGKFLTTIEPSKICVFLAFVDDTFVFTTYGTIASDFDFGSMGPWLVTTYNLGFAVMLPLYGRLCDVYGYKYPIQAAYFFFSVGCLMTGLSNSIGLAIAGRFLSGAGGSGMTDLLVVIINDMETPRKATGLRSYISIIMTIAVPVGAPLGGALTGWIGWRWPFIMQVPLSVTCLVMASWRLQATKGGARGNEEEIRSQTDFNLQGVFLLGLSVASIMTICQIFENLESELVLKVVIPSSIFLASVVTFAINERYWTSSPLIPMKLIKTNKIGIMYVAQFILFFSYGGICSHITEFWIRTKDYGNSLAAACILPVVFGNVISAFIGSRVVQKTGRYKKVLIACFVVAIVNGALLAGRWPSRPLFCDLIFYFGLGLGVGGILVCTFTALSISVPSQMTATAMSNYYLCQQIGLVMGVAVSSAANKTIFKDFLFQDIPNSTEKSKVIGHILNNLRFASGFSEPTKSIANNCFLKAFHVIPALTAGTLLMAFVILLSLPEKYIEE
ncbi:hypothetical protein PENSTE_c006G07571 [Penicillium steckii]|uniref:Major facilitator superfamily (MFS) profile domain-containing protein n=1 Tax=Penicillium steckii TaxID=303698 RepID=A0A1V6TG15_9EURO|nr:hypothetical protein PENSTE_c006G07571 [Penicillium steckii]